MWSWRSRVRVPSSTPFLKKRNLLFLRGLRFFVLLRPQAGARSVHESVWKPPLQCVQRCRSVGLHAYDHTRSLSDLASNAAPVPVLPLPWHHSPTPDSRMPSGRHGNQASRPARVWVCPQPSDPCQDRVRCLKGHIAEVAVECLSWGWNIHSSAASPVSANASRRLTRLCGRR